MKDSVRVKYRKRIPYKYDTTIEVVCQSELRPAVDIVHPQGYFTITTTGLITVPAGYAWDGPSGPAIDTKSFMLPSLFHDVPYQANQTDDLCDLLPPDWKEKTDKLLRVHCLRDGMWPLRAWWVYQSVKQFGRGRSRDLNQYMEELVAP